jgi:hemerythrin superfamily protein
MFNHGAEARRLLEREHAQIETLLSTASCSVREDACADAECRWNELETALLAHLDAEEMLVMPQLARAYPDEAKQLLREHEQIRCALGDIGIAFELHTVRADAIDAFCARLREHAAHEETLMYPLVASELSHGPLHSLLRRLQQRSGVVTDIETAQAGATR